MDTRATSTRSERSKRRVFRLDWLANKRTYHAPTRVSDEGYNETMALHEQGAFEKAVARMQAEPNELLMRDASALILYALCLMGQREVGQALEALDNADKVLANLKATVLLNRSQAYRMAGEIDNALAAAYQLREEASDWFASHLMLIALHELQGDQTGVKKAVLTMKDTLPKWRENEQLWSYLEKDSDYAALRADSSRWSELFEEQ